MNKYNLSALLGLLLWLSALPALAQSPPGEPYTVQYTVQLEDTALRLAEKYYRTPAAWPTIAQVTDDALRPEPLLPGQRLQLPAAPIATAALTSSDTAPLSAEFLAEVTAYVENARRHFEIPGAAVAVVRPHQIALASGLGERQLGNGQPVTPSTLFGIGSTTKAMNSLLLATLVDDGLISWDAHVTDLWPDFSLNDPDQTAQLRLRQLLNMSSGLARADLVWSGSGMSAEQVMESLAELPVKAPPGAQFEYNNQAVATAGYAAALAAGGSFGTLGDDYAQLMQQRLFDPIGMRQATFDPQVLQSGQNYATPHDFLLTGETIPAEVHSDPGIAPAGGVNASLLDLARFVQTQLAGGVAPGGQRLLSAETLRETWRPQTELYPGSSYGLGWFVEEYRGVEMVWHDGDVFGYKSLLLLLPEADVGLVLLSNRTVSYGFANSIRYHFVEQFYGLEADAGEFFHEQWRTFQAGGLPEARATLTSTPAPASVAPYLGDYQAGWQVSQQPDGTVWTTRGDYAWQLWQDTTQPERFVIGNGFGLLSPIIFESGQDEAITMTVELSTGEVGEYRQVESVEE